LLDQEGIEFLIKKDGRNLLNTSIERRKVETSKMLILKDFDVNKKDKNGYTPIFHAVKMGNLDLVKLLIEERSCDLNIIDKNGKTCNFHSYNLEDRSIYHYIRKAQLHKRIPEKEHVDQEENIIEEEKKDNSNDNKELSCKKEEEKKKRFILRKKREREDDDSHVYLEDIKALRDNYPEIFMKLKSFCIQKTSISEVEAEISSEKANSVVSDNNLNLDSNKL
jgi:hypothetical protein